MTAMDDAGALRATFAELTDEALLRRLRDGVLTDFAEPIARAEAASRGLAVARAVVAAAPADLAIPDEVYHGDFQSVATQLTPTEAHLLCDCLRTSGVPAITADVHLMQANPWLAPAMGGASVRVPAAFVAEAQAVLAAFRTGAFVLDDDFDDAVDASPQG